MLGPGGGLGGIAPLCASKPGDPGRSGENNRRFVESVLRIAHTGSPWRDLPSVFGGWNSVFQRFRRQATKGVFGRLFNALSDAPDFEYTIIDGTIVHQHGTGTKGGTLPPFLPTPFPLSALLRERRGNRTLRIVVAGWAVTSRNGTARYIVGGHRWLRAAGGALVAGIALFAVDAALAEPVSVYTYHNDNNRTGWNGAETYLTPGIVSGGSFRLLNQIAVDEQVDAQPLVVAGVTIGGTTHNVVYLATEANSIYAIDAVDGTVLTHKQFGSPVPMSDLPDSCGNNSSHVGINSTPVVDPTSGTLYFMAYTYPTGGPAQFQLHAVDLATLVDKIPPTVVSASHLLADNKTSYVFNASVSRQRPALLLVNGNVYAGFGDFCDIDGPASRGWMLGWNASTLAPLPANRLVNTHSSSTDDIFFTSVWMSGYGPASSGNGYILFSTGNSDPSGHSYDLTNAINLSESVVEVSASLAQVKTYFTPSDPGADVVALDKTDGDFGAGGVMIPPSQPGAYPRLAAAAGKSGQLYLLNTDAMGGYNPGGPNKVIDEESIGRCWCGPSYFTGSDGVGRIVTSGANTVEIWKIQTSPATKLVQDTAFPSHHIPDGQDPGVFTSVSSNGTTAGTAIIWTVSRPTDSNPADISLFAFDASNGTELFSATTGAWPYTNGNANLVPTVVNGRVYVGSYKSLAVFGVAGVGGGPAEPAAAFEAPSPPDTNPPHGHRLSGFVRAISGSLLTVETRTGARVMVDIQPAIDHDAAVKPILGQPFQLLGEYDASGMFGADAVLHTKPSPQVWLPDW